MLIVVFLEDADLHRLLFRKPLSPLNSLRWLALLCRVGNAPRSLAQGRAAPSKATCSRPGTEKCEVFASSALITRCAW
mgnify:CR=1 FL=1|jgi:hypothetical protein